MKIVTVKVVKGYAIQRYENEHGHYFVNVKEDDGKGWREFFTFRTIKEATKFIEEVY